MMKNIKVDNHQFMSRLIYANNALFLPKWDAPELVDNVLEKELTQSSIKGYSWKEELITYADIKQRWLLLESQNRKESDLTKLSERIEKPEFDVRTNRKFLKKEIASSDK